MTPSKLDNPVWHSLNEVQREFAIAYEDAYFYQPRYCPFGGFTDMDFIAKAIRSYGQLTNDFYVVGEKPNFDPHIQLRKELVCNQMILDEPIDIPITEEITDLEAYDRENLFQLVNMVQPGYFRSHTYQIGKYYGIFRDDELIAVAGERMKMNTHTEISAVVTHPLHTGKGYAKQLIAYTANEIFNQNKTPFLHVASINVAAINLYEKLGFKTRRNMSFWHFGVLGE